MRTFIVLLKKEFIQIKRNTFLLRIVFAFPFMLMLLMPLIMTMDVKNVNVALVDEDRSTTSRRVASHVEASSYLTLVQNTSECALAMAALEEGDVDVIVQIPNHFERDMFAAAPERISLTANAVNATKGGIGMQYVVQTIASALKEVRGEKNPVSVAVIRRLPRYHRYLGELLRDGKLRISSAELSRIMGVTASQIRQDFNCFGGFGQQGYGYNIKYLHGKIAQLLGVEEGYNAIIIGAGNLGRALAATHMFERRGVNRIAMFDIRPELFGESICGIPVYPIETLESFCRANKVDIGVLTVPKEAAALILDVLAECGVSGIWNFANMELKAPNDDIIVENIHLGDSLMTLCYEIKEKRQGEK